MNIFKQFFRAITITVLLVVTIPATAFNEYKNYFDCMLIFIVFNYFFLIFIVLTVVLIIIHNFHHSLIFSVVLDIKVPYTYNKDDAGMIKFISV